MGRTSVFHGQSLVGSWKSTPLMEISAQVSESYWEGEARDDTEDLELILLLMYIACRTKSWSWTKPFQVMLCTETNSTNCSEFLQNWSDRHLHSSLFWGVDFQLPHWFSMICPIKKNSPKGSSTFSNRFVFNQLTLLLNRPRKSFRIW